MAIAIPGSRSGARILAVTRRFMPRLERELVGESARVAYRHVVNTQRRLTGTLAASTNVSAGHAEGRGLTYGPGNVPLPVTVVDQALAARQMGEPLIISEDARSPEGTPYGMIIEARFRTFEKAQEAVRAALPAIAARAGVAAVKEAFS
jgi:hypothetical protein